MPFYWPRTLPCSPDAEKVIGPTELEFLRQRLTFWRGWVERYGGEHPVPTVIGLAVIAQESRGYPSARGCAGEVGLFQLIPSDPENVWRSDGCSRASLPSFPENKTASQLSNSMVNVAVGMQHLQDMAWFAHAIAIDVSFDKTQPVYKQFLADAPYTSLEWWKGGVGHWALAMNQCGQQGYWLGSCGKYGGDVYADDILGCWVPWITANILETKP